MAFEKIQKIKQTYLEEEVNEYLAKGYHIIKILSSKTRLNDSDVVQPIFILGLSKNEN